MATFETVSTLEFSFTIKFFAASGTEANTIAQNLINQLFGPSIAGTMELVSTSNSTPSNVDTAGANYTYNYTYKIKLGDDDASSPTYVRITSASVADALTQLRAVGQRITNITNFPLQVTRLNEL